MDVPGVDCSHKNGVLRSRLEDERIKRRFDDRYLRDHQYQHQYSESHSATFIRTCRPEDELGCNSGNSPFGRHQTAYCLLGIFDVNKPLLYGEEEKSFRRLQDEIIRTTPDLSIFAWKFPSDTREVGNTKYVFSGVLAKSPHLFAGCSSLGKQQGHDLGEISILNGKIQIPIAVITEKHPRKRGST
jgi:hypothetical protein